MKTPSLLSVALALYLGTQCVTAAPSAVEVEKRDEAGFKDGQPIDGEGKGGPILGM